MKKKTSSNKSKGKLSLKDLIREERSSAKLKPKMSLHDLISSPTTTSTKEKKPKKKTVAEKLLEAEQKQNRLLGEELADMCEHFGMTPRGVQDCLVCWEEVSLEELFPKGNRFETYNNARKGRKRFYDQLEKWGLPLDAADFNDDMIQAANATIRHNWIMTMGIVDKWNEKVDQTKKEEERKLQEMIDAIKEKSNRSVDKTNQSRDDSRISKLGGTKMQKIFGYPLTAVIRALADDGADFEDVTAIFEALGIGIASNTIKIQIKAAKTLERGKPAPLTAKQLMELHRAPGKKKS